MGIGAYASGRRWAGATCGLATKQIGVSRREGEADPRYKRHFQQTKNLVSTPYRTMRFWIRCLSQRMTITVGWSYRNVNYTNSAVIYKHRVI